MELLDLLDLELWGKECSRTWCKNWILTLDLSFGIGKVLFLLKETFNDMFDRNSEVSKEFAAAFPEKVQNLLFSLQNLTLLEDLHRTIACRTCEIK